MVLFMMRFSQKTQKAFDKESHFTLEDKNRQRTREWELNSYEMQVHHTSRN